MLWVINIYIYASHSDETVDFVNHVYKHAYTLIFKIAVLFRCWIAVLFCIAVLFRMRLFISSLLILCRVSLFHDMCCTYIYTNNDMHQIYYLYTTFICQICHHPSCFCAPSKQYIVFSLYWTRSMVCKKKLHFAIHDDWVPLKSIHSRSKIKYQCDEKHEKKVDN